MANARNTKTFLRATYLRSQLSLVRNIHGEPFSSKLKPRAAKALGKRLTETVIEVLNAEDVTDDQVLMEMGDTLYGLLPKQERSAGYHLLRIPVKTGTLKADIWCEVMCYNHLTFSICGAYFDFKRALRVLQKVVDQLEDHLPYAYHERLGYLSAQLTLTGSGLRVRSWMHLGGLAHFNYLRELANAGLHYGVLIEHTQTEILPPGNLFILFNRYSMRWTAEETVMRYQAFLEEVIRQEAQALMRFFYDEPYLMLDALIRVQTTFKSALLVSEQEALDLLSDLRIGVVSGAAQAEFNVLASDWFDLFKGPLFYPILGHRLSLSQVLPPHIQCFAEWRDGALRANALRSFADFTISDELIRRASEQ